MNAHRAILSTDSQDGPTHIDRMTASILMHMMRMDTNDRIEVIRSLLMNVMADQCIEIKNPPQPPDYMRWLLDIFSSLPNAVQTKIDGAREHGILAMASATGRLAPGSDSKN